VAFLASAFQGAIFIVEYLNPMEDLNLLLIDRLKSQGMDSALIPSFLKALTSIISSEPRIDPSQANLKLHALGWNEVSLDYHSLQIAIACLDSDKRDRKDSLIQTRILKNADPI